MGLDGYTDMWLGRYTVIGHVVLWCEEAEGSVLFLSHPMPVGIGYGSWLVILCRFFHILCY